jgi:hypothetical protein
MARGTDVFLTKSGDDGSVNIVVSRTDASGTYYSVAVQLYRSDTINIPPPPRNYYYECSITTQDGNISTVASGAFKLLPTMIR